MFLTPSNKMKWKWLAIGAAVTVGLVALGVLWFDRPLYLFMRGFDCGLWQLFDAVFDAKQWIAVSAIVLLVFYLKKLYESDVNYKRAIKRFNLVAFVRDFFDRTKNSYALFVFVSVLSASVLVQVLKIVIGRARPIFFEALGMTGFFPFNTEWAFNSMPSGHTAVTFAGLVMIGMLVPKIKWATWTLAILIGASRVCVGAHWPSDVLLGAFIGMVVADLVKYKLVQLRNK